MTPAWNRIVLCVPLLVLPLAVGCSAEEPASSPTVTAAPPAPPAETTASTTTGEASTGGAESGSEGAASGTEAEPKEQSDAKPGKKPVVVLETSVGTIRLELDPQKAPISTKNFLAYVNARHYDGLVFHRVIPDFMIQGGGFTPDLKQRETKAPIKNEAGNGLRNAKGTIAMARTSIPDSATSQFFINVVENRRLDKDQERSGVGYAVFGKVIGGMDVVEKVRDVPTGIKTTAEGQPMEDVPLNPVVIKTARVEK